MVFVAPTYVPKMTQSVQPNMGGLRQPEMAPRLELGETRPIHAGPRNNLRTPLAKPLKTPTLTPLKAPAPKIQHERAPMVEPHWHAARVGRTEALWR